MPGDRRAAWPSRFIVISGPEAHTGKALARQPCMLTSGSLSAFRDLARVLDELRQEAKEKGIDKMSKREINAAVAWARRDLKKNPPAK